MKNSTSAFVCALIVAGMAPRAGHAAVATMNTPVAAQKSFQNALTGLDASGWPAAAEAASVSQPMPTIVGNTPAKSDPAMTEELMARLIKYARAIEVESSVNKNTCKILNLCDGKQNLPLRSANAENMTDGAEHIFAIPRNADSKDVLFMRITDGLLESWLTDKTGKLRVAAVQTNGVAHLITNEKAAEQYQKELALFAEEAAGLPPTGAVVAGK